MGSGLAAREAAASRTNALDRFFLLDQGGRFAAFDGLRAWAILSVFCVHFNSDWAARKLDPPVLGQLISWITVSHLGVDLFFVLSGFLIYRLIVRTRPRLVTFMADRYRRLLPAHVAVILAGLATSTLATGVANTLFLNLFIPSMPALNFVTWSLGYEILFYAIGGVALISIARPARASVIISSTLIAVAACFALPAGWRDVGMFRVPDIRFMGFFFGVAAAMLYESKLYPRIERLAGWLGVGGVAACILLSCYVWPHHSDKLAGNPTLMKLFYLVADLGFTFICLAAAARPANLVKACFSAKPLRVVGMVSYSFYLCHAKFGISLGNRIADRYVDEPSYGLSFALGVAVSILMATFLFHFLEKPYFTRRLRQATRVPATDHSSIDSTMGAFPRSA
jgi:exopolysaccharide production protein ExoZ